MAVTDHYTLLVEYLNACEAALATTPGGVPALSYVCPGVPTWDCEQLVVHSSGPDEAQTLAPGGALAAGHRVTVTGDVVYITTTATVLRCIPVTDDYGNAPSASAMNAAASTTSADVWAIWNMVKSMKRAETLFAPKSRELLMDPAVALSPMGGLAGWQLQIRVQLGGYDAV